MCVAVPGCVASVEGTGVAAVAVVDFGTITRTVSIATLPDVRPGEWVIVHSGYAIRRTRPPGDDPTPA